MPCDYSIAPGGFSAVRYGIRDMMIPAPNERPWERHPSLVWCSLPGDDQPLSWPTQEAAMRWLRECLNVRLRIGGPAFYLPEGWYSPSKVEQDAAREKFSPWEDVPADSPLLRR
jgi:hypothetical protein